MEKESLSKYCEVMEIVKEKEFEILGYGPYHRLNEILAYNYGQHCHQHEKKLQESWDNITRREIDACNWFSDETTDRVCMTIAVCNYMGFSTPYNNANCKVLV